MTRASYKSIAPGAFQAMLGLEGYVRTSELDQTLLELVRTRASQLNGCAFCLDMHTKDALAAGDTPQRLLVLSAWREAPFYSERERAALAWTEAVTELGPGGVPDELYHATCQQFDERDLVDLTMAIITINGWNRLSVAFQSPEAGTYVPVVRDR